ncbi:MAG: hypothetical protein KDA96_22705, partial [Planctomycetaceae bacterium]|nr:hypothetical protein [Planctomycetaceae bacterium]
MSSSWPLAPIDLAPSARAAGRGQAALRRIGRTLHKLAIYSGACRERFCCPRAAHLRVSLSLYGVSVPGVHLSGARSFGVKGPGGDCQTRPQRRATRPHTFA